MLLKRALSIIIFFFALSGCKSLQPWVKPHQRGILADSIMAFDVDPASAKYMNHVYEAREAARGAESGAGGGCGCN